MASLPETKIKPQQAFLQIGVDYAEPVLLRSRLGRKPTRIKPHIAVFMCLVIRAIHLNSESTLEKTHLPLKSMMPTHYQLKENLTE